MDQTSCDSRHAHFDHLDQTLAVHREKIVAVRLQIDGQPWQPTANVVQALFADYRHTADRVLPRLASSTMRTDEAALLVGRTISVAFEDSKGGGAATHFACASQMRVAAAINCWSCARTTPVWAPGACTRSAGSP